jgi:hypothetical protein
MRLFHRIRPIHAALVAAACCVLAVGCSGSTSNAGKLSLAEKHAKVNTGMSEQEVTDIMGGAGSEIDTSKIKDMIPEVKIPEIPGGGGLPVGLPDIGGMMPKMKIKSWDEGNTVYVVIFQDGKVTGKDHGEKKEDKKESKITKANSDKIKTDMKKSDVEGILGTGTIQQGAKMEGFPGAEVMVWTGDQGVISVGFIDDKVVHVTWVKK